MRTRNRRPAAGAVAGKLIAFLIAASGATAIWFVHFSDAAGRKHILQQQQPKTGAAPAEGAFSELASRRSSSRNELLLSGHETLETFVEFSQAASGDFVAAVTVPPRAKERMSLPPGSYRLQIVYRNHGANDIIAATTVSAHVAKGEAPAPVDLAHQKSAARHPFPILTTPTPN
mgnify:CR=1 FL=1